MAWTSRRKRPLNRQIPHLRDARLIIIATEGEKTEKRYFESDAFQHPRVQIKVLETQNGASAPNRVIHRLKMYASETDLQLDDQLWLMVDKDRWGDELLSSVCRQAVNRRKQRVQLAVSNPCFEIWLYLHHADWRDGDMTCQTLKEVLRELLGSYNSSNLDMTQFIDGIDSAINRARAMDQHPESRWPQTAGTHVYKVVSEIRRLSYPVEIHA